MSTNVQRVQSHDVQVTAAAIGSVAYGATTIDLKKGRASIIESIQKSLCLYHSSVEIVESWFVLHEGCCEISCSLWRDAISLKDIEQCDGRVFVLKVDH